MIVANLIEGLVIMCLTSIAVLLILENKGSPDSLHIINTITSGFIGYLTKTAVNIVKDHVRS